MGKKKSKMGRPPLKAKDKRAAIITLRLKQAERQALGKEAAAKGMTVSSYLLYCWKKAGEK